MIMWRDIGYMGGMLAKDRQKKKVEAAIYSFDM